MKVISVSRVTQCDIGDLGNRVPWVTRVTLLTGEKGY